MPSGVSIIICTKNRSADLDISLDSVFSQRILPDTLVIVDDGDAEDTRSILKKFESFREIRVIHIHPKTESSGLPAARNRGIRIMPDLTGIILFLDDDVTLEETYLETLQDLFLKNPDLWGASGFIKNVYHNRSLPVKVLLLIAGFILPNLVPVSLYSPRITRTAEALYPLFRRFRADAVPAQWLSGCNMAYRSTVFSEGYTFDEHLVRYAQGEDLLFSHRLYQDNRKLLLSYNARLMHRISTASRIPPFGRLVMMFGYRNYEISRFVHNRFLSSFWYTVFVMQYILSSVIISIRDKKGLALVKEVIRAYGMTRKFERDIGAGNPERFNNFLSTLS
jgi:glycosyltransferase involved in cell wall biosynthesis